MEEEGALSGVKVFFREKKERKKYTLDRIMMLTVVTVLMGKERVGRKSGKG